MDADVVTSCTGSGYPPDKKTVYTTVVKYVGPQRLMIALEGAAVLGLIKNSGVRAALEPARAALDADEPVLTPPAPPAPAICRSATT